MTDTDMNQEQLAEAVSDGVADGADELGAERRVGRAVRAIGAGVLGLAGAGVSELSYRKRLAKDPEHQRFANTLKGGPVAARSADGTLLHAEVFEPATGSSAPTIILAPGWTETLYLYDSVTRDLLDHGFRVVGYDLRGQGHSNAPANGDYDLSRYGEDLEAVLGATCAGRTDVILGGHSMGGMSIAAWAADHQVEGRVAGTALMNTGMQALVRASRILPQVMPNAVAEPLARWAFLGNPLPVPPGTNFLSRATLRYVAFGPYASDAQVAFYERMLLSCPPSVRAGAGLALNYMDLMPALEHLTVPTMVLCGRVDRLTPPSQAEAIAEALPNLTELVNLAGVGHMGPLEAPHLMVAALRRLADEVGLTPAAAQPARAAAA